MSITGVVVYSLRYRLPPQRLSWPAAAPRRRRKCTASRTSACCCPCAWPRPAKPPARCCVPVTFASLPGWDRDDLRDAWPAFLASCDVMVKRAEWKEPCSVARSVDGASAQAIRVFFEAFFVPQQVFNPDGTDNGLVTGYYEPLLNGSRKRGGPYQTPLHKVPDDLLTVDLGGIYPELKNMRLRGKLVGNKVVPYPARAELAQSGALAGSELIWVDNPIDAFFLQVQGSGRVQLADSRETVRVAYADQNGHPYRSIGRYLVDKGELTMDQASAQGIKAWLAANPKRQQELLNANPGYVFFKEEKLTDPRKGPKGALGVPLTAAAFGCRRPELHSAGRAGFPVDDPARKQCAAAAPGDCAGHRWRDQERGQGRFLLGLRCGSGGKGRPHEAARHVVGVIAEAWGRSGIVPADKGDSSCGMPHACRYMASAVSSVAACNVSQSGSRQATTFRAASTSPASRLQCT